MVSHASYEASGIAVMRLTQERHERFPGKVPDVADNSTVVSHLQITSYTKPRL